MPTVVAKDGTEIYYKDWGAGQPLFFHHGWPLSADDRDVSALWHRGVRHRHEGTA